MRMMAYFPGLSIATVIERLHGSASAHRLATVDKLAQFRAKALPAVPALIDALQDHNLLVRKMAALALSDIGEAARAMVASGEIGAPVDRQAA
jgi:HEAT repeat protein